MFSAFHGALVRQEDQFADTGGGKTNTKQILSYQQQTL